MNLNIYLYILRPYFKPHERYSSGDRTVQRTESLNTYRTMKPKESSPTPILMGLNTIRLSGSTFDHFNTHLVQPEDRNIVNINKQFDRPPKGKSRGFY